MFGNITTYDEIYKNYIEPCAKMTNQVSVATVSSNTENIRSRIKVVYLEKEYQHVKNFKDFGFEAFFSGVGGFVGIFLGYSLMQVPELISNIAVLLPKLKN